MTDHIDVMVKLFDTLKESTDKQQETLSKLVDQQHELVVYLDHLPVEKIIEKLKEHSKDAENRSTTCTSTFGDKLDGIENKVETVDNRVGKMILVVIVAVTLFSFSLLAGTMFVNYNTYKQDTIDNIDH